MANHPYLRKVQEIMAHSNGRYKPALCVRAKGSDVRAGKTLMK